MKKPRIIGLTGGIGSGKTTIAKIFESLGIPVYISDLEAKRIMEEENVINQIKNEFGPTVLNGNQLDRGVLAKIVFEDHEKLKKLNNIVHPAVAEDFKNWVSHYQNRPFVIKETAILFEIGGQNYCDKTILVTAPIETRIRRVMERDQTSEDLVKKRMANQWLDEKKIPLADFIIHNVEDYDLFKIVKEITKTLNNM